MQFPPFLFESFELLLKFGKSSFLRKQESSLFKTFWIPAYAGMTKWGYFSKLSILTGCSLTKPQANVKGKKWLVP
jgi:hypothetical protein